MECGLLRTEAVGRARTVSRFPLWRPSTNNSRPDIPRMADSGRNVRRPQLRDTAIRRSGDGGCALLVPVTCVVASQNALVRKPLSVCVANVTLVKQCCHGDLTGMNRNRSVADR